VLNDPGIHETSGVHDHPRPQKLQRLLHLRRLTERLKSSQQERRIDEAVPSRRPPDDLS
jgi:hypothetical protein